MQDRLTECLLKEEQALERGDLRKAAHWRKLWFVTFKQIHR